jgi:hypothetical protein
MNMNIITKIVVRAPLVVPYMHVEDDIEAFSKLN